MATTIDSKKYKNAILKMAKEMDKYELGTTKLAKILYYFDFISYRDREKPAIADDYFKQENGPLAKHVYEMVNELIEEDKLKLEKIERDDKEFHNYTAQDDPDESVFDDYELELLNKLINKYKDWETDQIVAKSHLELPWRKVDLGRKLSFEWAFDIDDFDEDAEEEYKKEDKKLRKAFNDLGVLK